MKTLLRLLKDTNGTTVSEYAIISMMVALFAAFSFVALGIKFLELFPI